MTSYFSPSDLKRILRVNPRVGDMLAKFRNRSGVTVEELALKISLPVSAIQRWESGFGSFQAFMLEPIFKALSVSSSEYLEFMLLFNQILNEKNELLNPKVVEVSLARNGFESLGVVRRIPIAA
jgi:transcriptional regulator with XRE-family HTH domain